MNLLLSPIKPFSGVGANESGKRYLPEVFYLASVKWREEGGRGTDALIEKDTVSITYWKIIVTHAVQE